MMVYKEMSHVTLPSCTSEVTLQIALIYIGGGGERDIGLKQNKIKFP
jgi:hypothetical protein